jgi:predicted dithiol-disulfide oxidoreductase (DUF899 family)
MSDQKNEELMRELSLAEESLKAIREQVVSLRKQVASAPVDDYELADLDGNPVTLSSLFGDKDDLILVHNMGKGCRYCTLWADGFVGLYKHLENRAAFALVSFDDPVTAREFSSGRNWPYRVLSNNGSTFARDMHFETSEGKPWPGVSTFHRDADGGISRVAYTYFGPGDDFCALWHMFDLLKDGTNGWEPQYAYE